MTKQASKRPPRQRPQDDSLAPKGAAGAPPQQKRPRSKQALAKPAPLTPKGRKRRQQLLDATARALNRFGYRDLSIANIADEAGAPISLFYRYFTDKTEAVLAALDEIVGRHKSRMPASGSSLFDFQIASHRNLIQLFTESPGVLDCYYALDAGETPFTKFFQDQTRSYDRMHAERAIVALDAPKPPQPEAILPLAHAVTAMADNFLFRYCTGRDETAALERAARVDVSTFLAQLRVRMLTMSDVGVTASSLPRQVAAATGPRPEIQPVETPGVPHKRQPKRSDSTASFDLLKSTALRLLNLLSYDELRIRDIEEEGAVTRGGIYHYFGEKRELVATLLREQLETMHARLMESSARPAASRFEDLRTAIAAFLEEYRANPGVLRALYRLEQDDIEITDMFGAFRRVWARALADLVGFHLGAQPSARAALILIGYAMLAMIERFSYDLGALPSGASPAPGHEQAELLAAIWLRALFLEQPPAEILDRHSFLRDMVRQTPL